MTKIQEKYIIYKNKNINADINEHFPTLKKYSEECQTIVEMGVRSICSTWAFLAGLEGRENTKLISIDILHPSECGGCFDELVEICRESGVGFEFRKESTLLNKIEEVDMLFIDTDHTYEQLSVELKRHSPMVKKYIIMHDTEHYKDLPIAINEFLDKNNEWKILEHFKNNYGLTIICKVRLV